MYFTVHLSNYVAAFMLIAMHPKRLPLSHAPLEVSLKLTSYTRLSHEEAIETHTEVALASTAVVTC